MGEMIKQVRPNQPQGRSMMETARILTGLLAVAALLCDAGGGAVQAATATASFTVSVTIVASCTVGAGNMAFGSQSVLAADDHAWPRFDNACARGGYPVDAARAFPANPDTADCSFGVAGLVDPQATLTGLEQRSSHALPFMGRYRLAFKTKLKSGRHVQSGRDCGHDSAQGILLDG